MSAIGRRIERLVLPDDGDRGRIADLRRLAVRTVVDTFDDRVPGLAAEMAFYFVLSLPPLLLVVLGSVGYVLGGLAPSDLADLERQILDTLGTFLSADTVEEVLAQPVSALLREGRSDVLSLGVVLTLWSASRATNVLMRTVTIAYDLEDHRPIWKRRLLALAVTLVGIVLTVSVLPLLAVGPRLTSELLRWANLDPGFVRWWPVVYWLGVVVIVLVALTWLYHITPSWATPWARDFPGAVLALAVWVAAGAALRIYTGSFAGFTSDAAFQGLAAPLVLLLWVYVTAVALLLGAELNAEIERLWPSDEGPYEDAPPPKRPPPTDQAS